GSSQACASGARAAEPRSRWPGRPAGDRAGMADDINTQLDKYLTDVHSIEEQALAQLRTAPDIAGEPELARVFSEHLKETEEQERLVRERLEAHDGGPSRIKDAVMAAGGKGFVLFARSQPDTPGKLVT